MKPFKLVVFLILLSCNDPKPAPPQIKFVEIQRDSSYGKYYAPLGSDEYNAEKLQLLVDSVPVGSTIILPNGIFWFKSTITVNRELRLQGSGNTMLHFDQGATGIIFSPKQSSCSYVSDLNLRCMGTRTGTSGNGIEIHARMSMSNVFVSNFGGTGIWVSADIGHGHSDVSRSIFHNVEASECGRGFYTQGGDANGISFYDCSARDCDGDGFMDNSFLGDNFYSCMTHANKGHSFAANDPNNRATFVGCYCEGGQGSVYLNGASSWYAGRGGPFEIGNSQAVRIYGYYDAETK